MGRFLMLQSLRRLMFDRDRAILKQIHSTQARFERLNMPSCVLPHREPKT